MSPLALTLPLRIRELRESFTIDDSRGIGAFYVYFEPRERDTTSKRVTRDEALAIIQFVARALTDRLEAEQGSQNDERPAAPEGSGPVENSGDNPAR